MSTASLAVFSTSDVRLSFSSHPRPKISSLPPQSVPVQISSSSSILSNGLQIRQHHRIKPRRCSKLENPSVELPNSPELKAKSAELIDILKGTSLFLVGQLSFPPQIKNHGMNDPMKKKTGIVLAEALQYCYFDSDEVVEQVTGGAVAAREICERDEEGFLESESEVLRQLSSMARLVVCVGESASQGATNLSYLRYGISIWIDTPLESIAGNSDEAVVELARRHAKMKGGYATADATISILKVASKLGYADTGDVMPEDVALEVLGEIYRLTRVKKMMEDAARPF